MNTPLVSPTLRRLLGIVIGLGFLALLVIAAPVYAGKGPKAKGHEFVKRAGPKLKLHGRDFHFAGTNNYYLMYKSPFMVDDVLETAADNGFNVVRTWGFLDIGNQDGSNSTHGIQEGVYFHYWDGDSPAYNDGADGLERLDYVVAKAGEEGIRLVIPLTNNWSAFGGMDQYVRWADGSYHDEFYTDPQIKQWYKDWISHLLNRTNVYTGVKYKDDPTIMTWELANEPRCIGSGAYPRSPECTPDTITNWADEMSHYIHSIDNKHLISVGDEGFYCDPSSGDWIDNCNEGVDWLALAQLEKIDVLSFHLYPDHWGGRDAEWGSEWIERHVADAKAVNKPVMLGEYGWQDQATRNEVFQDWANTLFEAGGDGALYWILSGYQDDGSLYPDYDGFTVYCPSPVCTTISNFAAMMAADEALDFDPVADNDSAVTEFDTPVTLDVAANDIAYAGATVVASSIDLDPATAGQQTSVTVAGGTFALQPDFSVLYTPASGFVGQSAISYTIADSDGSVSNAATIRVTVKPSATAPIVLSSFETGTEGWAPANWQSNAGTVSQSSLYPTDGSYSLEIVTADGGWFGFTLPAAEDISGKSVLKYDITTTNAGTNMAAALQLGADYTWCEPGGNWTWVSENSSATAELDLLNLACTDPDPTQLQVLWIYVNGGGTYYVDFVRAES